MSVFVRFCPCPFWKSSGSGHENKDKNGQKWTKTDKNGQKQFKWLNIFELEYGVRYIYESILDVEVYVWHLLYNQRE